MSIDRQRPSAGFTLVELMVALTIAGLLLAVSVPMGMKFYDSLQYRDAVRSVLAAFQATRQEAVESGTIQDIVIYPESNELSFTGRSWQLHESVNVVVSAAGGLRKSRGGVIRFYPEGGATGGNVELESRSGKGVRISVDWLTGRVTQEAYAFD